MNPMTGSGAGAGGGVGAGCGAGVIERGASGALGAGAGSCAGAGTAAGESSAGSGASGAGKIQRAFENWSVNLISLAPLGTSKYWVNWALSLGRRFCSTAVHHPSTCSEKSVMGRQPPLGQERTRR